MSTRNIVPNADNEGNIGKPTKYWQGIYTYNINEVPINQYITQSILNEILLNYDLSKYLSKEEASITLKDYVTDDLFKTELSQLQFTSTAPISKKAETLTPINEFSNVRKVQEDDPINANIVNMSLQQLANRDLSLLNKLQIQSNTIYVNGTNGNDVTGEGTQTKPFKTIQRAIDIVGILNSDSANVSYATINISAGVPYQAPTIKNKSVYLFCSSTLTLSGKLVIDNNAYVTTNCNIVINSPTSDGLIIKNSIFSPQGSITINSSGDGCTLINSSITTDYAIDVTSSTKKGIILNNSTLQCNDTLKVDGYIRAIESISSIINCTKTANISSTSGKGLYFTKSTSATFSNVVSISTKGIAVELINSSLALFTEIDNLSHSISSSEDKAILATSNSNISSNSPMVIQGGSTHSVVDIELASIMSTTSATIKSLNGSYGVYVVFGGIYTYNLNTFVDCMAGNTYTNSGGRIFTGKQ